MLIPNGVIYHLPPTSPLGQQMGDVQRQISRVKDELRPLRPAEQPGLVQEKKAELTQLHQRLAELQAQVPQSPAPGPPPLSAEQQQAILAEQERRRRLKDLEEQIAGLKRALAYAIGWNYDDSLLRALEAERAQLQVKLGLRAPGGVAG